MLVVSDNQDVQDELKWAFGSKVEVVEAREARDAWLTMQADLPSVVVVDLQTGSAGGFGLCHDMKANGRYNNVPLIMLIERPQDDWLALQAGADQVMVKPVTSGAIVAAVEELLAA